MPVRPLTLSSAILVRTRSDPAHLLVRAGGGGPAVRTAHTVRTF